MSDERNNYLGFARWYGPTTRRYLGFCDSDAEGAFKVYREDVVSTARARIAELENRNNRALEIEDNLKDQLAQLQVERDSWLRAKNLLEAEWTNEKKHDSGLDEVINLQKQLAEAQKEIRAQRVLIALGESAEREVDELQSELSTAQARIAELEHHLYEAPTEGQILELKARIVELENRASFFEKTSGLNKEIAEKLQAQLRASTQTCGCGDIRPASEFCHLCGKCQMGCCFCVSEKEHAESKARIAELEKQQVHTDGHHQPCCFCREECNNLRGNPMKWSTVLAAGNGEIKYAHIGCVANLEVQLKAAKEELAYTKTLIQRAAEGELEAGAERDALKGLLKEALPFVGWAGRPDGLIDRIESALESSPLTNAEPSKGKK